MVVLVMSGAGKTYLALKLAELLREAGQPLRWSIQGDFFGLRTSADGDGEGLAFTLLGGGYGDVALEPIAGALVADLIVSSASSASRRSAAMIGVTVVGFLFAVLMTAGGGARGRQREEAHRGRRVRRQGLRGPRPLGHRRHGGRSVQGHRRAGHHPDVKVANIVAILIIPIIT